jgi:hypothetical protein
VDEQRACTLLSHVCAREKCSGNEYLLFARTKAAQHSDAQGLSRPAAQEDKKQKGNGSLCSSSLDNEVGSFSASAFLCLHQKIGP